MAQNLRIFPAPQTSPMPAATPVWPIPGDVPDIEDVIDDQATTIKAQAALIDAYQAVLSSAQSAPTGTPANSTGTAGTVGSPSNQITVTGTTGTIVTGAIITSPVFGIAGGGPPFQVLGQISGTPGGDGVYLVNYSVVFTSIPLTFTPPALTTVGVVGTSAAAPNANQLTITTGAPPGSITIGATVLDGSLVPSGTIILGQISGTSGAAGVYLTSNPTSCSNTNLTINTYATSSWPVPTDAPTLELIREDQTAILRMQSSLIQNYQQLLNDSQTTPPPTGP